MSSITARIRKEREKLQSDKIDGIEVNFYNENEKHFLAKV